MQEGFRDCVYIPVDYQARGPETIVCDFNRGEFPDKQADVSFVSGCLEYIENPSWFIEQIAAHSHICVISYCSVEHFDDPAQRAAFTWKNSFDAKELVSLFLAKDMRLTAQNLIQWSYLLPFALAALGTLLGILINTSAYSALNGTPGFEVNMFWSIYNIAILLLAAAVCIELPQQRQHARFPANEQAVIRAQGQADSVCTITDISLGGAKIAGSPPAWAKYGAGGVLLLDGGALQVPFRFIGLDRWQNFGQGFPIVFEAGIALRRALSARLFGGAYRGTIDEIDIPRVLFALGKRLLR